MVNTYLTTTSNAALGTYINEFVPLVIPNSVTNISTIDTGDAQAIIFKGNTYSYSPNNTRPADNVSVLQDFHGRKFSIGADLQITDVSRIVNVLPLPVNQLAPNQASSRFLVGDNPTGDLAGHANEIAFATYWGLEFITPSVGQILYIRSDDTTRQYTDSGTWRIGVGTPSSIDVTRVSNVEYFTVEGVFSNPAISLAQGKRVIIGDNATGAFQGNTNKIAEADSTSPGGYKIITPRKGWTARDNNRNVTRTFDGTRWNTSGVTSPLIDYDRFSVSPGGFNPVGNLETNTRRVIWSYTAPQEADFSEFEFPGEITMQLAMSRNVGTDGNRNAEAYLDFHLHIGGRRIWEDRSQRVSGRPHQKWHFAGTIVTMAPVSINVGTEASNVESIRWSDESSRTAELVVESWLPTSFNQVFVPNFRRIDSASGVVVSRSYT